MRIGGPLALEPAQLGERAAVGGRVGEQQVVEAVLVQPQRLGSVNVISPRKPGSCEDRREQRAAAHRLARHPDRRARRSLEHLARVRPHRVEIHERERRVDVGEDPLELLVSTVARRRTAMSGSTVYLRRCSCWAGSRRCSSAPRSRRRCSTRSGPGGTVFLRVLFAAFVLAAIWRPAAARPLALRLAPDRASSGSRSRR